MGWGGRWEGGSGWGTHVNPWLIHVNVWQKPQQYCKVISLQLIKIKKNHDGVMTHLEPDILECECKWVLGSITMNKASGVDGIPVELFQILRDDAGKVLQSICQQIWKT